MNWFVTLLVTALYSLLLQNLIFTGGFGTSEAIRISSKPRYVLSFALFITVFSAATSLICRALDLLPQIGHAHIWSGAMVSEPGRTLWPAMSSAV